MWRWVRLGVLLASATLCLASAVLWASSLLVTVRLDYTWVDRRGPVWSVTGPFVATGPHQLTLGLRRIAYAPRHAFVPLGAVAPPGLTWQRSTPAAADVVDVPHRLGFGAGATTARNTGYGDVHTAVVTAPFWAVLLAAAVGPARRATTLLRRWRPANLCRGCGYDVRATPTRCPECGLGR